MSRTVETVIEVRLLHVDIPDELILDQRTSRAPAIPAITTRHRTCRRGTR